MIWVKITARHRRVLMASHALEKVQLDAAVGHPVQIDTLGPPFEPVEDRRIACWGIKLGGPWAGVSAGSGWLKGNDRKHEYGFD